MYYTVSDDGESVHFHYISLVCILFGIRPEGINATSQVIIYLLRVTLALELLVFCI